MTAFYNPYLKKWESYISNQTVPKISRDELRNKVRILAYRFVTALKCKYKDKDGFYYRINNGICKYLYIDKSDVKLKLKDGRLFVKSVQGTTTSYMLVPPEDIIEEKLSIIEDLTAVPEYLEVNSHLTLEDCFRNLTDEQLLYYELNK